MEEQEKIKEIVFNKEIAQVETELAVFWELISSNLPQSIERSALGDSKIFYAFKGAYPEIKNYIRKQTLEEAIASVDKYKEFTEKSKIENLERDNVMLAYDMDSRWVASKHILSNLQALKDKNK